MLPFRVGCWPVAFQVWCVLSTWDAHIGARLHRLVFGGSLTELGVRTPGFKSLLLSWWDFLSRSLRDLPSWSV